MMTDDSSKSDNGSQVLKWYQIIGLKVTSDDKSLSEFNDCLKLEVKIKSKGERK